MIRSLRIKLMASHTLPLFLLTPILTLFVLYNLQGFYSEILLQHMRYQGLLLQDQLENSPNLLTSTKTAQPFIVQAGHLTNARILLLSQNGLVMAYSRPEDSSLLGRTYPDSRVMAALNGKETQGIEPLFTGEYAFVLLPLRRGNTTVAALRLSYDVGDMRAEFEQLERLVLIGGLLILLVGMGLGLGLATTITRPLQKLSDSAQRIAQGHYQARVQVHSGDEVGALAHHFNRMAERLEETEQARTRQLAAIIHELARPISGMRAAVDTLRDEAVPDEQARAGLLDGVAEELGRLDRLVDTLELLQKRSLRPLELNRSAVSIERIIRASTANYQPRAAQAHINLSVEVTPELPLVYVDEDRLIQVLTNLLDNAIKFTPPEGVVTVQASPNGNSVRVSVSDSGIGLDPSELPHMFQEFYRGGPAHPSEKRGMGLGLAICRDIIAAHGGTIQAASSPPGGAKVTFTVPYAK